MSAPLIFKRGSRMPKIQIMPSILAADIGQITRDCAFCAESGADCIHVDVMDARFVKNLSLCPGSLTAAKKASGLPQNVHLMLMEPQFFIQDYIDNGAETIQIHLESRCDIRKCLTQIRENGVRPALTINPETPVEPLFEYVDEGLVDEVLFMSVHPGLGGQKYIPFAAEQASKLRMRNAEIDLAIDGGIAAETIAHAAGYGINKFVAGGVPSQKTPH